MVSLCMPNQPHIPPDAPSVMHALASYVSSRSFGLLDDPVSAWLFQWAGAPPGTAPGRLVARCVPLLLAKVLADQSTSLPGLDVRTL